MCSCPIVESNKNETFESLESFNTMMYSKVTKCGDYCKNLCRNEEKSIIERLLREELQHMKSVSLKANIGKTGERKYLINA